MLPVLEGVIARRVLVNFSVEPAVAAALVPRPLTPALRNGFAVAGICLIRLERLRPKGVPGVIGLASENMAHRIAIRYPTAEGPRDGVFIWRRDTDQALTTLLGGRLFPGVHRRATFRVSEGDGTLAMDVKTQEGLADVTLSLAEAAAWAPTRLFETFADVVEFFRKGDCGFSCSLDGERLEGMQLRTLSWSMQPLAAGGVRAAFYADARRFPPEAIRFDGAVLMRGIPHEWHELGDVPELATAVEPRA